MDKLDKLNAIFKSGDIALGIQLIKSLDLELYDVLLDLYHKFKYLHIIDKVKEPMWWWVLDTSDPMDDFNHCIRFIENETPQFKCWYGENLSMDYYNIEDCITELTRVLNENHG